MTQTAVESPFKTFEVKPQLLASGKTSTRLGRTDIMSCTVQVVASGGETNLHAHSGDDATWLVLGGRVRFYTTDNAVVAELGAMEGLIIPRGTPYWFESASDENLVIMRFGARAQNESNERVDYSARNFATSDEANGQPRHTAVPLGAEVFQVTGKRA